MVLYINEKSAKYGLGQAFFLTSAAEKTKTQGQNSSKKLKEKTQPLGATLLKFLKTQEKTHPLAKFPGVPLNMPFLLSNIFKKGKILEIVLIFFQKSRKKHFLKSKFQKTQGKNSKLKEKTQNSRKKLNLSDF